MIYAVALVVGGGERSNSSRGKFLRLDLSLKYVGNSASDDMFVMKKV
jgi:hypothetical protein